MSLRPLPFFITHGFSRLAHPNERHRVQPDEDRPVGEADRSRERPRFDVAEAGVAQHRLERSGFAEAVAAIDDGAEVVLGDPAQLPPERNLVIRSPVAHRDASARRERTVHLAHRRAAVGEELQALLADDDIELFPLAQGKRRGIPLAPIDIGRDATRDPEHRSADVDADDRPAFTEPGPGLPGDGTGAARDVENAIARPKSDLVQRQVGPGAKQRSDEQLLVHFRKARLCKGDRHYDLPDRVGSSFTTRFCSDERDGCAPTVERARPAGAANGRTA